MLVMLEQPHPNSYSWLIANSFNIPWSLLWVLLRKTRQFSWARFLGGIFRFGRYAVVSTTLTLFLSSVMVNGLLILEHGTLKCKGARRVHYVK